ncbi:hypothetical protein [Pseudomonas gingeri]|uniref:hypothetical protein n=1 Tax=Pseudomonas gingeri TaxID=117681 RepID=UPI001C42EE3A|nr:hypothetical protein [Pseudomonas gingeri]
MAVRKQYPELLSDAQATEDGRRENAAPRRIPRFSARFTALQAPRLAHSHQLSLASHTFDNAKKVVSQPVPERQELNDSGQLYGAMSLIYRTKKQRMNKSARL